jgi:hypothetical protein
LYSCTPSGIPVHKDGNRRDLDAAKSSNNFGLGDTRGQVSGQEASFFGGEDQTQDVRDGRVVCEVYDSEVLVRIGSSSNLSGFSKQEADGDDDVAAFFNESVDVALVVRLLLRFQNARGNAKLTLSHQDAFPGSRIEGAVINTASVCNLAGAHSRRLGSSRGCVA